MGLFTAIREDAYPVSVHDLPNSGAFDLAAAGTMAWAAQLAYEVNDQAKVRRILARWGWRQGEVLSGTFASHLPLVSTKGFTATAGEDLVIAFAGTEPTSLLNWITDFSIHRTAEGITDGFLAGFEAVRTAIEARLAETGGRVLLTGHSLGGAICVAAANSLVERGILSSDRLLGVYTIGMPRPGNESYAETYDAGGVSGALGQHTFRLVHGDDIVPMVPPSGAPFGFRHVGMALTCPSGGTFAGIPSRQDPQSGLGLIDELEHAFSNDPGATSRLPAFPAAHPLAARFIETLPHQIRDHLPDRYLAALQVPARD
jgi:triacylglycerol lipase